MRKENGVMMIETATRMAPSSTENQIENEIPNGIEGRLYITQSPFYSPAFNGAIFDGPLRLYFSQSQEALALKLYFELRARTQDLTAMWPRSGGPSLYVMLYPTEETFDLCFVSQGLSWTPATLPTGRLGKDHVVALQAPECEADLGETVTRVVKLIDAIAAQISKSQSAV